MVTAAAVGVAFEAVIALAYALALAGRAVLDGAASVGLAWSLVICMLVFALGLGYVAKGLTRTALWARSPALVAQALLLVVGVPMVRGGQLAVGLPLSVLAASVVVLLFTPSARLVLDRALDR